MRVDEGFDVPRVSVAIIAIGDSGEALLLRAVLENLGAAVNLHLIGTPQDLLRVLRQGKSAPRYVLICAHGNEDGIVFGDYKPSIDVSLLANGSMSAASLRHKVNLPGRIVISTACGTGSPSFGEIFLNGGVLAYVAPSGEPDGTDAGLFIHLLFYELLQKKRPLQAALHRVHAFDDALKEFKLFPAAIGATA